MLGRQRCGDVVAVLLKGRLQSAPTADKVLSSIRDEQQHHSPKIRHAPESSCLYKQGTALVLPLELSTLS